MAKKKAFALRVDEAVWKAIQRWSDDELRSVNAQIEYVLRDVLRKNGRLGGENTEQKPTQENQ